VIALRERRSAHRAMRIKRLDGAPQTIGVTTLPVIGQGDRFLGTFSAFWERD
jgi:hypothetical protein